MAEEKITLSKQDRRSVALRSTFLQGSWNYERMQNGGWCFAMIPAIKKLYTNKEDQKAALKRHLEFFNTHPYVASPVLGVTLALEEEKANGAQVDDAAIQGVKVGMMGPLAGVGDPVFWFTARPMLGALGASLAMGGSILGPILFFVLWNVIRWAFMWYTQEFGYRAGSKISEDLSGGLLQKVTKIASILGMFVLGSLIERWVSINFIPVVSKVKLSDGAYIDWNSLPAGAEGIKTSRVFTIKEGKNIEENDKNSIIVHEEFAKQNNLKLGDEVNLELLDIEESGKIKSHKFKIIGIFSVKKQDTYTGLSSDFSENMVFVDYSTSQEILNKSENNKIANKILMYSGSAESTDLALNKLKELKIDESKYFVQKDSNAFEESLESVSGIKHMIKIMTYSIMLGGIIVLSLILILWLRERIYEIGIFLSIGTSKIQIIMQFIFELLFISIPSIISSLFLGNVLIKVIAGGLINSENSMISGGNLINDSSFMLNITTLGQSYLILISIIVLSVVFASSLILIKKPKEILSKIS